MLLSFCVQSQHRDGCRNCLLRVNRNPEICWILCPIKLINTSVLCTKEPTWCLLLVLCFAGKFCRYITRELYHMPRSPGSSVAFWQWRKTNKQNSSPKKPPASVMLFVFSDANLHWKCVHRLCDDAQPARPQTRRGQKQRWASSTGNWLHRPVLHLHQKVGTVCNSWVES